MMEIKAFDRHEANAFYRDVMAPLEQQFRRQNAWIGVQNLYLQLMEHAYCSSVTSTMQPRKQNQPKVLRDVLGQVSLPEHSFRVARIAAKAIERDDINGNLKPREIVVALGHDIGKVPSYQRDGIIRYGERDHAAVSAKMLNGFFPGSAPTWLPGAKEAIANHHRQTDDPLTLRLKQADWAAREQELNELAGHARWEEWFSAKELLALLEPHVNFLTSKKECPAFTFRGQAYVDPDLLYELAKKLMQKHDVLDISLLTPTATTIAKFKIVASLRAWGAVPHELPSEYYAAVYIVATKMFRIDRFMTPLSVDYLPEDIAALEKRRAGWLEIIRSVTRR